MKFQNYLNESEPSMADIIKTIEKDCQPFLKDWKRLNVEEFLLSGRKEDSRSDFIKKKVRKNRKPVDTPLPIHNFIDDWFFEKFGVRARSNSVFCTFDEDVADSYGKPYMIFPIGKYTAIFSESIEDIYDLYKKEDKIVLSNIKKILEKGKYKNKLEYTDSEIMIVCNEYYLVSDYLDTYNDLLSAFSA